MSRFENNQEEKKKKKGGILFWILICICAGAALFSGYKLWGIIKDYRVGRTTYNEVEKKVIIPAETSGTPDDSDHTSEDHFKDIDFSALKEINEDAIGWIYCPGTKINYPMLHAADNSKYLRMTPDYKYYIGGSIFVDYRNSPDFTDKNTIVYGHQMNDGTMFEALRSFKSQQFYEEHPYFYITLQDGKYLMEVFSCYVTNAVSSSYNRVFQSDEEFLTWLNEISYKSNVITGIKPSIDDRIVTLSTCTYDFENARYVVHGRLVKLDVEAD